MLLSLYIVISVCLSHSVSCPFYLNFSLAISFSESLELEASVTVSLGVDFNDSTQAASFQLW